VKRYESLVVVGSSGTGKTTVVNGLRIPQYADQVVIPHRYITRPPRIDDDLTENSHLSHAAFDLNARAGIFSPHWQRILEDERVEKYGFDTVAPKNTRLRVYSANNAFLRDLNETVQSVLAKGLVVMLQAETDFREQRLGLRSPDMGETERAVRLQDNGQDISELDVDLRRIDTSGLSPEEGQLALRGIVDRLIA
jgi:ribose 1,5-bisphosphokinase PhnN